MEIPRLPSSHRNRAAPIRTAALVRYLHKQPQKEVTATKTAPLCRPVRFPPEKFHAVSSNATDKKAYNKLSPERVALISLRVSWFDSTNSTKERSYQRTSHEKKQEGFLLDFINRITYI